MKTKMLAVGKEEEKDGRCFILRSYARGHLREFPVRGGDFCFDFQMFRINQYATRDRIYLFNRKKTKFN